MTYFDYQYDLEDNIDRLIKTKVTYLNKSLNDYGYNSFIKDFNGLSGNMSPKVQVTYRNDIYEITGNKSIVNQIFRPLKYLFREENKELLESILETELNQKQISGFPELISYIAMDLIVEHEFSHVLAGHLYYKDKNKSDIPNLLVLFMEMEADRSAIKNIFDKYKENEVEIKFKEHFNFEGDYKKLITTLMLFASISASLPLDGNIKKDFDLEMKAMPHYFRIFDFYDQLSFLSKLDENSKINLFQKSNQITTLIEVLINKLYGQFHISKEHKKIDFNDSNYINEIFNETKADQHVEVLDLYPSVIYYIHSEISDSDKTPKDYKLIRKGTFDVLSKRFQNKKGL